MTGLDGRPDRGAAAGHWSTIGEQTFVGGMWLLYGVFRLLGRWPFLVCLYPVVVYYWATQPTARRASLQYLQRMQQRHGAIGSTPGWRHGLRHFLSFADTILDKMLAMNGRYRLERVRFFGHEPLLGMIDRRQGAVVVTAHVGCLELCQAAAVRRPAFKLTVLVHTAHAERFNRVLRRLRPDAAVTLLQVSEVTPATAALLADKVERGEFVAIAGDRVPLRPTVDTTTVASFLGHEAPFPIGPYVLASLFKCPLYSMVCLREREGHAIHFDLLAQQVVLPRATRRTALAGYAAQFAALLEQRLVAAPYDWFNFFPFWSQPVRARDNVRP